MKRMPLPFLDLLLPPSCLVCNAPLPTSQRSIIGSDLLCKSCHPFRNTMQSDMLASLPSRTLVLSEVCQLCGEPLLDDPLLTLPASTCLSCSTMPFCFLQLRSLCRYCDQTEAIIKQFKYRGRYSVAPFLAEALAHLLSLSKEEGGFIRKGWDLLIPIPSPSATLRIRGFNHMALICRRLSSLVKIPSALFALKSGWERSPQASLPPSQRFTNVQGRFTVVRSIIAQKRLLLVDDVITSGATMHEAASVLLANGAKSVDAMTVFRSQQFQTHRRYLNANLPSNSSSANTPNGNPGL